MGLVWRSCKWCRGRKLSGIVSGVGFLEQADFGDPPARPHQSHFKQESQGPCFACRANPHPLTVVAGWEILQDSWH